MSHKLSLERRKANRLQDAYILFLRHKIEMDEYHRLQDLINSPDLENFTVAIELIKAKNKKKKK